MILRYLIFGYRRFQQETLKPLLVWDTLTGHLTDKELCKSDITTIDTPGGCTNKSIHLDVCINKPSVSRQLSDRSNYRIKHPIIILRKYPGLDYQELANYFRDAGKL